MNFPTFFTNKSKKKSSWKFKASRMKFHSFYRNKIQSSEYAMCKISRKENFSFSSATFFKTSISFFPVFYCNICATVILGNLIWHIEWRCNSLNGMILFLQKIDSQAVFLRSKIVLKERKMKLFLGFEVKNWIKIDFK